MLVRKLDAQIDINASLPEVWELLTDFEYYPAWNPYIKSIEGVLDVNAQLEMSIKPPGMNPFQSNFKIKEVNLNKRLAWIGHMFIPCFFNEYHYFQLEEIEDNKMRLVQGERFTGLLVPFLYKHIAASILAGFELMNAALKEEVEKRIEAN